MKIAAFEVSCYFVKKNCYMKVFLLFFMGKICCLVYNIFNYEVGPYNNTVVLITQSKVQRNELTKLKMYILFSLINKILFQ